MIKMLMFDLKTTEEEFLNEFDTSDFEITSYKESLNTNTRLTVKECDETSIISVFITSELTKNVLNKFKNLRAVVTRSVCYQHIDINECRRRNIAVINVENYGKNAISQYVVAMIFGLTRNIVSASCDFKNQVCNYEKYESENIDKLTLGVIGTGYIGSGVCELAHRFGMKVFANDIVINNDLKDYVTYMSLNDVLRKSDVITLHIPYVKEFKHLISEKEFEIMKDNSYIINTSHHEIVDLMALYRFIKCGKISGAGLDIIPEEKDIFDEKVTSSCDELRHILILERLLKLNNVIITPRISYDTKETLRTILKSNFHSLKDFFIGRKTNRVV